MTSANTYLKLYPHLASRYGLVESLIISFIADWAKIQKNTSLTATIDIDFFLKSFNFISKSSFYRARDNLLKNQILLKIKQDKIKTTYRLDSQIETVDSQIETVDSQIETVDSQIETVDSQIGTVDSQIGNGALYSTRAQTTRTTITTINNSNDVDDFSKNRIDLKADQIENFAKKYLEAYFENNTAAQKFSSPKYELEVLNYLKSNKNYFLTNNALAMKALSNYFNYNSVSDTYPMSPKNFLEIHKQYLDANNLPANCKIRTDVLTNMMREREEQENGGRKKDYYDYRFGERAEERRNENKIPTGNIEKDNYINSFKKDFKLILTDFYTKAKSNGIKKDDLHDYAVYNYNEDWIEEYWKDEPEKWEAWAQRSFGISWYLDNVKFRSMPVEMFIHYFCNAAYEAKGLRWR